VSNPSSHRLTYAPPSGLGAARASYRRSASWSETVNRCSDPYASSRPTAGVRPKISARSFLAALRHRPALPLGSPSLALSVVGGDRTRDALGRLTESTVFVEDAVGNQLPQVALPIIAWDAYTASSLHLVRMFENHPPFQSAYCAGHARSELLPFCAS